MAKDGLARRVYGVFAVTDELEPIRRLARAILDDALAVLAQAHLDPHFARRRIVHQTAAWVAIDDRDWVFSFVNVCSVLDLAPQVLRSRWLPLPGRVRRIVDDFDLD